MTLSICFKSESDASAMCTTTLALSLNTKREGKIVTINNVYNETAKVLAQLILLGMMQSDANRKISSFRLEDS